MLYIPDYKACFIIRDSNVYTTQDFRVLCTQHILTQNMCTHMCLCTHLCTHVVCNTCVYTCVTHVYTCVHMFSCVHMCTHPKYFWCVHMCTQENMCTHVYLCVHMYNTCVHTSTHVYICFRHRVYTCFCVSMCCVHNTTHMCVHTRCVHITISGTSLVHSSIIYMYGFHELLPLCPRILPFVLELLPPPDINKKMLNNRQ